MLAEHVGPGDLVIDLAWNIGCVDILQWCHDHDVLYLNTSVELWDPYADAENQPPTERTLYVRHMAIRERVAHWLEPEGPTAVLEHGANPGLVSHFIKVALRDIARKIIAEKPDDPRRSGPGGQPGTPGLRPPGPADRRQGDPHQRARHAGDRSAQGGQRVRQHLEHRGLSRGRHRAGRDGLGHARAPAAAGRPRPQPRARQPDLPGAHGHQDVGALLGAQRRDHRHGGPPRRGVHHLRPPDRLGGPASRVYRPTVHYAYCPTDAAVNSLHELEMRNLDLQPKQRILTDEIVAGRDELGVLLMGHDFTGWWTGSLLDIHESRELVPGQNATTLQVACSVLGAVTWMIRNRARGSACRTICRTRRSWRRPCRTWGPVRRGRSTGRR